MSIPGKLLVKKSRFQVIWEISKGELASLTGLNPAIFKRTRSKMDQWQAAGEIGFYMLEEAYVRQIKGRMKRPYIANLPDDYLFRLILARGAPKYEGLEVEKSIYEEYAIEVKMPSDPGMKSWDMDFFYLNIKYLSRLAGAVRPCKANVSHILSTAKSGSKLRFMSARPSPKIQLGTKPFKFIIKDGALFLEVHNPKYLIGDDRRKTLLSHLNKEIRILSKDYQIDINKDLITSNLKRTSQSYEALGIDMPLTIYAGTWVKKEKKNPKPAAKAKKAQKAQPTPTMTVVPPQEKATAKTPKPSQSAPKPESPAAQAGATTSQTSPSHQEQGTPPPNAPAAAPETEEQAKAPERPKAPKNYPGKGLLDIEVAPDKMSCKIVGFKQAWFEDASYTIDEQWLEYEMIRLGIIHRNEDLLKRVKDNLKRKRDVNALQLAIGDPGKPPEEPKLTVVAQKSVTSTENNSDDGEKVDFRKSRITTVAKGSKIAEFVFEKPGENGSDLFGGEIPHPEPELPPVQIIGEGVKAGHHYDYIAAIDGLAKVDLDTRTIEVSKTYLVEGDVSLATGDIDFDGSVHITGCVRDKATIKANKDVTIEKGIANCTISCKGTLTVELGIVKSAVNCKGDINAGFIENSTIFASKHLKSARGLVNCQVVAQSIQVAGDQGLIGGGSVYCQSTMETVNLGFAEYPTLVTMGVDWNTARAISINENREKKFSKELDETEKSLALFMKKSRAQTTKAQEEMKDGFNLKIKKLKKIIKKVGSRLRSLKVANSECNQKALIKVTDHLRANARIMMGTKRVSSLSDCRSVYVSFLPKRGSNIYAIPEDEGGQRPPEDEASTEDKAS